MMYDAIWQNLLKLAPWLLFGTFVAALLHVWLPAGFAKRRFTGRGGVFRAVLFGVPLPLCSCGVVPTGIGLKKEGASDGAAVGFLISTPQTGVDSILVSASFLGWHFAILKVIAAAVTGVLGGLFVDEFSRRRSTDETDADLAGGESDCCSGSGKLQQAIAYGAELIRSIWGWLVAGILISAVITVFIPPEKMAWTAEAGVVVSSLMVLAISVPLYVCATASVPIAAALVGSGFPAGAALVFLMAGPATNVTTIGAVYRHFGGRVLALYLGTIIVGSIVVAVGFDSILTPTATEAVGHSHQHAAWWEVLSSWVLLVLLAYFAILDGLKWFGKWRAVPDSSTEECKSCG